MMHLSPGDRLGRYEVLALLGVGGMGEVYRGHDSELDRQVAVKVLPKEIADDAARLKRFKREAKAVAKLSHANILEIFDFGRHDDITYAVTELLEGQTLRELLDAGAGALPWKRALPIVAAIAEGLAAAHAKGVVHRDIKPANLFLCSDGRVKILDFGLASVCQPQSEGDPTMSLHDAVSSPGAVIGTVGYMSPEQVRGEPADARTDIFALGCVIHEILSGHQPFRRRSSVETLAAVLHDEPTPLDHSRAPLPPGLEVVIARCLEKAPDRRFQSASDLAFALRGLTESTVRSTLRRRVGRGASRRLVPLLAGIVAITIALAGIRYLPRTGTAPPGLSQVRSIAVLPLDNLSGDPDQEYFADGMTEVLITELSRVGALTVISRTSAMRFKGTTLSLPEIAAELGVDAVIRGSVQREANRVRVNAQLIDGATDRHLWAQKYERELEGVLAMQSEVARAITYAVAVELSPGEATRLADTREVDPETFEAYLRGMHFLKKGTPEGFERGMIFLQEAVDADPADPLAYAGLATGYVTIGHTTGEAESFRRAEAAARRAVELDESSAEAQGVLAQVALYHEWDWAAAERAFERALELNPNNALARAHYAYLFVLRGEWEAAIAQIELGRRLDPLAPIFTVWVSETHWGAGRYDDAIAEGRRAVEASPGLGRAHRALGQALASKGMFDEAVEHSRLGAELQPIWKPLHGTVLVAAGRRNEARALLEELTGDPGYRVNLVALAAFQAAYGDVDGAIASLERGYAARDGMMPWIGSWFDWSGLADHPRYRQLLRRMNLEYIGREMAEGVPASTAGG